MDFKPITDDFWEPCIVSGAQRTVVGEKQANTYLRKVGGGTCFCSGTQSSKRFRFVNIDHESIEILELLMHVACHIVITFDAHLVPINIPLLLGLHVLRKLRLLANFYYSTLSTRDDWRMQLVYKFEHMYAKWPPAIYYTEAELESIHRHFFTYLRQNFWDI